MDVALLYQKVDLFCLPSIIEGFPNVICEAMASGLPVICSNVCDNPFIVKSQENGFLFKPEDPTDIADNLIKAISLSEREKEIMGTIIEN